MMMETSNSSENSRYGKRLASFAVLSVHLFHFDREHVLVSIITTSVFVSTFARACVG